MKFKEVLSRHIPAFTLLPPLAGLFLTGAIAVDQRMQVEKLEDERARAVALNERLLDMNQQLLDALREHVERYTPCSPEQKWALVEDRKWLMDHADQLANELLAECTERMELSCPFTTPEDFSVFFVDALNASVTADFFCPSTDQYNTYGNRIIAATPEQGDPTLSAQIFLYPKAWDRISERRGSVLHELGHYVADPEIDPPDHELVLTDEDSQGDWVFVLGETAARISEQELEE